MRAAMFLIVVLLPGCLDPLPTGADFPGSAKTCAQDPSSAACKAESVCVTSGKLWCNGACVASDSAHCGSCDALCRGGACEKDHCGECSVRVGDSSLQEPALAPGDTLLPLDCPNLPPNALLVVRLDAGVATANLQDDCRAGNSEDIAWALEVESGEWITFTDHVHAEGTHDALQAVHQIAQRLPVGPDGHVRARVRVLEGHVAGCPARVKFALSSTLTIKQMDPQSESLTPQP